MKSTSKPTLPYVPSDHLKELRTLTVLWSALSPIVGPILQIRLVLDTNMVIGDLLQLAKPRVSPNYRTALQELMASETVICYAPEHLKIEMERHWQRIAAENHILPEVAAALWTRYAAQLRFCPVSLEPVNNQNARDPADLSFIALAAGIGAQIYSRDRDIPAMGGHVLTMNCIFSLQAYARHKAVEVTIKVGGMAVASGTLGALILMFNAVKKALSAFMRLPAAARILILLCLLWALGNEGRRKTIGATIQKMASGIAEALGPPLRDAFDELGKVAPMVCDAARRVEAELQAASRLPLRVLLRAVLAGETSSLSLREIDIRVRAAGYLTTAKNLRPYIQRLLRQDRSFCQAIDGTWRLAADTL